jgi:hypothetical protein
VRVTATESGDHGDLRAGGWDMVPHDRYR